MNIRNKIEGNKFYNSSNLKALYIYKRFKESQINIIYQENYKLYIQNFSKNKFSKIIFKF